MSLARLAVGRLLGSPGVTVFRGVPYAAARRFQPPEPLTAWGDLREARTHGPIAPQPVTPLTADLPQDEACLTLSVATPGLPGAGDSHPAWPVIVHLHGGLYQTGAGSLDLHDPGLLASDGECVVVSLNYRLGVLGFLHLPGVAEGNMGLQDMIAGLRWVRDNIGAFGGDAANVTLVGHDAGAHAILCLLTMWESQGLFHRAILQSPPLVLAPQTRAVAQDRAGHLCRLLGVPPAALAGLSLAALLDGQRRLDQAGQRFADVTAPFLPVFDALADVRRFTAAAAEAAGARGIDMIMGTTREEMHGFIQAEATPPAADAVAARFGDLNGAPESIELYRRRRLGATTTDLLGDLMTDHLFLFPVLALADAITEAGARAWVYQCDWSPAGSPLRACHGIDVPMVFGTIGSAGAAPLLAGANQAEAASLSAAFRAAWTEFAATGDPDAPGLRQAEPDDDALRHPARCRRRPRRRRMARRRQRLTQNEAGSLAPRLAFSISEQAAAAAGVTARGPKP